MGEMWANFKSASAFFILFSFCSLLCFAEQPLTVQAAAAKLGASVFWDPVSETGVFEKDGKTVSFKLDSSFVMTDFALMSQVSVPIVKDGTVFIDEKFLMFLDSRFLPSIDSSFKIGAVLIDAGHGGKDPGAVEIHTIKGKTITVREKDITLAAAKEVHALMKKKYPDKKILMTRETDIFLSLEERVNIANSVKLADNEAVLYISIHVNAAFDKKAKGFEVWYLSPGYRRSVIDDSAIDAEVLPIINSMMEEEYTTESILISKFILDSLDAQIGKETVNRGIKQEEWFVVRNTHMPSVLIEIGFLTNYEEAVLMLKPDYLRKTAVGIYNGLESFITHFEKSRGFTGSH